MFFVSFLLHFHIYFLINSACQLEIIKNFVIKTEPTTQLHPVSCKTGVVFVTALIMAAPVYSHYYISAGTIKQVSVADSYMVVFLLPPKMKLQYALSFPSVSAPTYQQWQESLSLLFCPCGSALFEVFLLYAFAHKHTYSNEAIFLFHTWKE